MLWLWTAIVIECFNCGMEYPPTATRWRCPACGMKDTCCDGAPAKGRRPLERDDLYYKGRDRKVDYVD